jgi:hypothetical protein
MSDDAQFYFPSSPPTPPSAGSVTPAVGALGLTSGGFGAGPFGSMTFGSGGGLDVAEAIQVATNAIRVRLSGDVPIMNRGDVRDALYDRAWTLDAPYDPGVHIPLVYWVERESSSTVILFLDADLEGPHRRYRVIASPMLIGETRPISGRSAEFLTFGEAKTKTNQQTRKSFDIGNRAPGTFETDADGDYRNDAGLEGVKKRVMRRLTTGKGAFAHLPNYGLKLPLKRTYSIGDLRMLQADALAQVQDEGVVDAQVVVSSPEPGLVRLVVTGQGLDEGVDVELRRDA